VNLAVTEMDKVTQQNAATAEESASASEELNAQAEELKGFVAELTAVVGGNAAVSTIRPHIISRPKAVIHARKSPPKALVIAKKPLKGKDLAAHRSKEVHPDDIIPMDENDFKDF
jgi:methyl-accepting chemotaxis protein